MYEVLQLMSFKWHWGSTIIDNSLCEQLPLILIGKTTTKNKSKFAVEQDFCAVFFLFFKTF